MMKAAGTAPAAGRRTVRAAIVTAGGVAMIAAALFTAGFGQGSSPNNPPTSAGSLLAANSGKPEEHYHPGRPAHIHTGSCDDLGEVAFSLNPVGAGTMAGTAMEGVPAMAIGEPVGSSLATAVEVGRITLETPLEEIAAGSYALNVQISELAYGNDIACGDIGGEVSNGTLAFGLAERNASGFSGLALLKAEGRKTAVTVFLAEGLM